MKKYLLLLVFTCLALTSCSTDETITLADEGNGHSALRGNYWDGVIGFDNGGGNYQFAVSPQVLMSDLEEQLRVMGDSVVLHSIAIVDKKAANDNTNGYMLVASDNEGTSIGLMLIKGADQAFRADKGIEGDPDPSTISCRGCATGCNLEYLNMPGGKYPYCNTNGCGDFCQTKYASML
jgi:hypothetical protein